VQMLPRIRKFFSGVIYRDKLQVHPQAEEEWGQGWRVAVVNVAVLAFVLRD